MKQGMRKFLMICGIVISVGLLLSLTGWLLGGIRGLSGVEDKVHWVSFGGDGQESRTLDMDAFTSIDLECDTADVEFIEGETFTVETSYDKKLGMPGVEVKNGTLTVTPQKDRHWWVDLSVFKNRGYADTEIKIYYPKGTVFKTVQIENDMGELELRGLQAERVDISSDVGNMKLDALTADFLHLEVDMGSITGIGIQTKGADIQSNVGDVKLTGAFAGTTQVSCDMADCRLETSLDKDSYAIHTQVDMGDCSIDGENVGNAHTVVNSGAENKINVEADAGDIEIDFQ